MDTFTYHDEFKIITTQVLDALGQIVIERINEINKNVVDKIHVNLRYSPKQRILHDLVNQNQHIQLPAIALSIGNISYDVNRTFNKILGYYNYSNALSSTSQHSHQPVPINITYNLTIISKFQNDLDRIITTLFSQFYPYITISYQHPYINEEVRAIINWDGNLNMQFPEDLLNSTPYRIVCNTNFKVNCWLFKNEANPVGNIYRIKHTFNAVSDSSLDYYDFKALEGTYSTDYRDISARPQIKEINPYLATICLTGSDYYTDQNFVINGDMFNFVTNLFVSGIGVYADSVYNSSLSAWSFGTRSYSYFSSIPSLSSKYSEFNAISVQNWSIIDEHNIMFTLPYPMISAGYLDVIAVNEAGQGFLTVDSFRNNDTPFLTALGYFTYQHPWLSGLQIVEEPI